MTIADRLRELGVTLPPSAKPVASYLPAVRSGSLLYVSGQLPTENGRLVYPGKVPEDVSLEDAATAARLATLNGLAAAQKELGSLDAVRRVVRVAGHVASSPGFGMQPAVINGASDLLVAIFGERGRHARAALGAAELPLGACVEIELLLEFDA